MYQQQRHIPSPLRGGFNPHHPADVDSGKYLSLQRATKVTDTRESLYYRIVSVLGRLKAVNCAIFDIVDRSAIVVY